MPNPTTTTVHMNKEGTSACGRQAQGSVLSSRGVVITCGRCLSIREKSGGVNTKKKKATNGHATIHKNLMVATKRAEYKALHAYLVDTGFKITADVLAVEAKAQGIA